jgi:hypothetical protein
VREGMGEGWIHGSEEGRSSTHDDARPDFALILTHFLVPPPPLSAFLSPHHLRPPCLQGGTWKWRTSKRKIYRSRCISV